MKTIHSAIGLAILAASFNPAMGQDTVRVRAGAPKWGSNVVPKQLYVLGAAPDYRIRVFYGMTVDRANRVYIYDLSPQDGKSHLDAYDANGTFARSIGQKGSGPGEHRILGGMTVIDDSILATFDFAQSRITLYQPNGDLLRSIPLTRSVRAEVWFALPSDTSNLLYLHMQARINGADGNAAPNLSADLRGKNLRMRSDGQIVDSIVDPPLDELATSHAGVAARNFVPEVVVRPTAIGGIVYGRGDTYRFVIQPVRGPVRVVERDWKPIPLTSEERDEWVAFNDFERQRSGVAPARGPARIVDPYDIPRVKAAYRRLNVDQDGRIWVGVFAPATKQALPPDTRGFPRISWKQPTVLDVFDPSGQYLGTLTFPVGSAFAGARGDRLWIQSIGPDDEHLITAYQIPGLKSKP